MFSRDIRQPLIYHNPANLLPASRVDLCQKITGSLLALIKALGKVGQTATGLKNLNVSIPLTAVTATLHGLLSLTLDGPAIMTGIRHTFANHDSPPTPWHTRIITPLKINRCLQFTLIVCGLSAILDGVNTYFFTENLPYDFEIDTQLNQTAWQINSAFIGTLAMLAILAAEGSQTYTALREYHYPEITLVNKSKTRSIARLLGTPLGMIGAIEDALESWFCLTQSFAITSLPTKLALLPLAITNACGDYFLSGKQTVLALQDVGHWLARVNSQELSRCNIAKDLFITTLASSSVATIIAYGQVGLIDLFLDNLWQSFASDTQPPSALKWSFIAINCLQETLTYSRTLCIAIHTGIAMLANHHVCTPANNKSKPLPAPIPPVIAANEERFKKRSKPIPIKVTLPNAHIYTTRIIIPIASNDDKMNGKNRLRYFSRPWSENSQLHPTPASTSPDQRMGI